MARTIKCFAALLVLFCVGCNEAIVERLHDTIYYITNNSSHSMDIITFLTPTQGDNFSSCYPHDRWSTLANPPFANAGEDGEVLLIVDGKTPILQRAKDKEAYNNYSYFLSTHPADYKNPAIYSFAFEESDLFTPYNGRYQIFREGDLFGLRDGNTVVYPAEYAAIYYSALRGFFLISTDYKRSWVDTEGKVLEANVEVDNTTISYYVLPSHIGR